MPLRNHKHAPALYYHKFKDHSIYYKDLSLYLDLIFNPKKFNYFPTSYCFGIIRRKIVLLNLFCCSLRYFSVYQLLLFKLPLERSFLRKTMIFLHTSIVTFGNIQAYSCPRWENIIFLHLRLEIYYF